MIQSLLLVLIQMQLIKDQFIAFDQFGCRKTYRKVIVPGMILDQMGDSVKASVDGASVIILIAIIPAYRALLIVSHMDGMPDQLFDSFTAGCRDRNDRNSQECLQVIDPDEGIAAIGSGGNYALAAARALVQNTDLSAAEIAEKSLHIAASICVYTNDHIIVETV